MAKGYSARGGFSGGNNNMMRQQQQMQQKLLKMQHMKSLARNVKASKHLKTKNLKMK